MKSIYDCDIEELDKALLLLCDVKAVSTAKVDKEKVMKRIDLMLDERVRLMGLLEKARV